MEDAVDERRNGKDETDKRARSADIKQSPVGEDGRANHDESAKRAVQVGEGNEEGISRVNMMIAAGKEMAELVGEKNGKQSKSKWQACGEAERIFVKKSETAQKFVEREGLILGIGGGELSSGDEAGAEGEEE